MTWNEHSGAIRHWLNQAPSASWTARTVTSESSGNAALLTERRVQPRFFSWLGSFIPPPIILSFIWA